ncbi:excinuclease ABC subunit C [Liquorilactobacillus mali KCTC 3596 = DSM 20444]|nr:helix-hairpin-helix domain-containing protein [Liquorilactobacillus mali]EJE98202.1 excinuclease ABC subunit C [Liquorilactobacillus mali KCTC 3596 = DSM 20444]
MNMQYQKVSLNPKSEAFYLLQRIQDEVHRFAITFHRQTHSKKSLSSRLDLIPGVGPKSRIKLLRKFGSMKKIADASLEDIEALGIPKKVAQTIKLSLK